MRNIYKAKNGAYIRVSSEQDMGNNEVLLYSGLSNKEASDIYAGFCAVRAAASKRFNRSFSGLIDLLKLYSDSIDDKSGYTEVRTFNGKFGIGAFLMVDPPKEKLYNDENILIQDHMVDNYLAFISYIDKAAKEIIINDSLDKAERVYNDLMEKRNAVSLDDDM